MFLQQHLGHQVVSAGQPQRSFSWHSRHVHKQYCTEWVNLLCSCKCIYIYKCIDLGLELKHYTSQIIMPCADKAQANMCARV
jgi:hypothetical protein